jgi:hypothetical protein
MTARLAGRITFQSASCRLTLTYTFLALTLFAITLLRKTLRSTQFGVDISDKRVQQ